MTSSSNSSRQRTSSYRQQKSKSKQIDNQLYSSTTNLVENNNSTVQRPLRILLMGPRNCGIKTFLMNALDMEADDFMIRSMLAVSQRVNQLSTNAISQLDEQLTFQQRVETLLFSNKDLILDVHLYICRGIKYFLRWERRYFDGKSSQLNQQYIHGHENELTYQDDFNLLDEIIEECREKSGLNQKMISLYSKIVNYSRKNVMEDFYKHLSKSTTVRYLDNIHYFFTFESFNRITSKDYIPLNQDLLKSHHTNDIHSGVISIQRDGFEFIDITGQLNERRKWIHQFSNSIDFVMFFIPISDYNLVNPLSGMNRLDESFQLYNEIQSSKVFKGLDISVILTKMDLFKKKLVNDPISNYFEKFKESNGNLKQTMETMRGVFSENFDQDSNIANRRLFVHQVDLTDSSDFKIVYRGISSSLRLGTFFSIFANKR